jgi:hypothetical protein
VRARGGFKRSSGASDAYAGRWAPDALIRLPSLESGVNTWAARATPPSAERVGILGRFLTGGTVREGQDGKHCAVVDRDDGSPVVLTED